MAFGPTVHALEDAVDVLGHYRAFARRAPRQCRVWVDLMTAPPLPFLPERYHGTKVLTLMQFYAGNMAEAEAVLAPLRSFGTPIGDAVGATTYSEAQSRLDMAYDKGARNYWRAYNFIAEGEGRERDAYGANYGRLAALKARYDPDNLLRSNQNIRPSTT